MNGAGLKVIRLIGVLVPAPLLWISAFYPVGATLEGADYSGSAAQAFWIIK
jgi:hypothetical protein